VMFRKLGNWHDIAFFFVTIKGVINLLFQSIWAYDF